MADASDQVAVADVLYSNPIRFFTSSGENFPSPFQRQFPILHKNLCVSEFSHPSATRRVHFLRIVKLSSIFPQSILTFISRFEYSVSRIFRYYFSIRFFRKLYLSVSGECDPFVDRQKSFQDPTLLSIDTLKYCLETSDV